VPIRAPSRRPPAAEPMRPETGFLALADLTGYTAYLARGEIAHAPRIAGDLLETVVGRLEPPFRLAKLEGDAAFLYVETGRADGSLLLDAIEAAYLAFRRRLRSIETGTSCDCAACSTAPRLDLKLFLHHGSYVRHRVARRTELSGRDVIIVHRLLKGSAGARVGHGFAQLTDAAIAALGIDPRQQGMTEHAELIDGIGELRTFVRDLDRLWSADEARPRILAPGDGSVVDLEVRLPAPPATVWSYLTRPDLRAAWEGAVRIQEVTPGGRRGVGSMTTCVTARLASLEEVVDWQPYEHVARRVTVPGVGVLDAGADLIEVEGGTRLRVWSVPAGGNGVSAEQRDRLRAERRASLARLAEQLARPQVRDGA